MPQTGIIIALLFNSPTTNLFQSSINFINAYWQSFTGVQSEFLSSIFCKSELMKFNWLSSLWQWCTYHCRYLCVPKTNFKNYLKTYESILKCLPLFVQFYYVGQLYYTPVQPYCYETKNTSNQLDYSKVREVRRFYPRGKNLDVW